MMKVFSKCSVVLFGLMLFFGNNDSCYGADSQQGDTMKNEANNITSGPRELNSQRDQYQTITNQGQEMSASASARVGVSQPHQAVEKNAGIMVGNFISGTCVISDGGFSKFLYISGPFLITMISSGILGYSPYKYILGGFNFYTCNVPGFLPKFLRFFLQIGLSYKINNKFSIIIFGFSTSKFLIYMISLIFVKFKKQNVFWTGYLHIFDIGVISIEFSKWFSFRISIGSLIMSCIFYFFRNMNGQQQQQDSSGSGSAGFGTMGSEKKDIVKDMQDSYRFFTSGTKDPNDPNSNYI